MATWERNVSTDHLVANSIDCDTSIQGQTLKIGTLGTPVITLGGTTAAVTLGGGTGLLTVGAVGSALTIKGAVLPAAVSSAPAFTIYQNFNGTTGFVTAANAADKIVDQFTIPAGSLAVGRTLRIESWGIRGATANSVVVKHFLGGTGAIGATITGGTLAGSVTSVTSAGIVYSRSDTLIQTLASNAASFNYRNDGSATQIVNLQTASTVDLSAAVLINLTMNTVASTDQTTTGWVISIL